MTEILREQLATAFSEFGMEAGKHTAFLPRVNPSDYLLLLRKMHILIDSVGWNGGNTSLQSIEAGVPLVTLPGEFMRGRHTLAMFRMMGIEELISRSVNDYADRLAELDLDPDIRSYTSSQMLIKKENLYEDQSLIDFLDRFFKSHIGM